MNVRIVADSTADVTKETREKITVIPLPLFFGEEEYLDTVSMTYTQFYEKLIESDELPRTSQCNPDTFLHYYEEVLKDNDSAVVITLSSTLSGTYQNAVIAAEDYEGKIFVVDSLNATIGSGILVEYAQQLAEKGLSAKEIADKLNNVKGKVHLMGMVETLEYLRKGGRLSSAAAIAGELLSIKPVLCIQDGEIVMLGKARGSKRAKNLLIEEIEKAGGIDYSMPLLLAYSGISDTVLKKYVDDSHELWKDHSELVKYACIGSVIGTHLGPGAAAIAFFEK